MEDSFFQIHTREYQSLRPPHIASGSPYPYSRIPKNRADTVGTEGSNDSGYATRSKSVASSVSQESYPAPSYQVQGYPAQSFGAGRQPAQQSASYFDGIQRSPDTELVHGARVSSTKHKKERRLR